MTEILRQSVPTREVERYFSCGWAYLRPDFDTPDHSLVEWRSGSMPVYPASVPEHKPEITNDANTSVAIR